MTQEETYKIVLMVEGEDKAKKLADELAKTERNIKSLKDSYAQGNVQAATYNREMASLTATQAKLNREVENAVKSYQRLQTVQASTNAAASGGVDAFTRYGQALSQIGYIADDAQYGIRGLVNNIQPLAAGLGLGGGVAGVLGLVAVAASQVYQNWDQIAKLWDAGASERESKRLEKLKETAKEYKEVLEAIAKNPGAEANASRTAASSAIGSVGGKTALAEITKALQEEEKRTPFRSGQPVEERAKALLGNAEKGYNGGPQYLNELFGPGTKRSDNTALGRAMQASTGTGLDNGFVSPEEEKRRQRDAMIERGRIENEKDAADAAKLKARTLDWMADEDRVGKNLDRNVGREINEDKANQRANARARAQEIGGGSAPDLIHRAMLDVARRGGTEGQIAARGQRLFMQQGMSIEEAQAAVKEQMNRKVDAKGMGDTGIFGPRQIFSGFAAFKDSVMTSGSGNDPMARQLAELQKSNTTLRELVQTFRERTYPTVAM